MPDPTIVRPYDYEPVADQSGAREWLPAFEISSGVPERLLESARADARSSGYAVGWAQGMREAREQMAAEAGEARQRSEQIEAQRVAAIGRGLQALDRAATELERRSAPAIESIEQTVVEMAVAIAQAVLGHELRRRNDRMIIQAMARTLALVPANEPVTIRLSPEDHAALDAADITVAFGGTRPVSIVAAPELKPGDSIAVCGATQIDARVEPALARIREALEVDDAVERRAR